MVRCDNGAGNDYGPAPGWCYTAISMRDMRSRARVRWMVWLVGLVIATASITGCSPMLGYVLVGDYTDDLALRRAAREFSCPPERVNVVSRADISQGLHDVEACGRRARYMCTATRYEDHCVREPNPAQWDPDPALCRSQDASQPKPAACYTVEPAPPPESIY